MGNVIGNFTGFDGRIGRMSWWIGTIILIIVSFILFWVLGMVMGTGAMMTMPTAEQLADPAYMQTLAAGMQKTGWVGVIVSIIIAYPYLALGLKRRHDRNNNGYDLIGFFVLVILSNLLTALGMAGNIVATIVSLVVLVGAIYILIVLGFLKGTAGPNTYGPDPLGGA